MDRMSRLNTTNHRRIPVIKTQLNVNAPVFVPSWEKA